MTGSKSSRGPATPPQPLPNNRFLIHLRQRWWVVFSLVALCTFGAAIWYYRQPPSFRSTAKMVVNGKITVPGGATYSEELTNFFGTQVELMQSDEVRHRAAQ